MTWSGPGGLRRRVLVVALLLTTAAASAEAQWFPPIGRATQMTLSGLPLTVTSTSVADFEAGAVLLGSFNYTVDLTSNWPFSFSPRRITIELRCSQCPASGTLAIGRLQWRRADVGGWTTISTTFAEVEERVATFGGTNDPWTNAIVLRYLLDWTATPPATGQMRLQLRMTVASP